MLEHIIASMKSYAGFVQADAARLNACKPLIEKHLPAVTDSFYDTLRQDPDALALFPGGEVQITHQRRVLQDWLRDMFNGTYGVDYFRQRLRVGQTHIRVGLPQHYMFSGMILIWDGLKEAIRRADPPDPDACANSLHKLLMLDLGIMLQSYKEGYSAEIRKHERSAVEEKLTRAEHLAEIGQLAASLAHEIKNPLAGISGAIQIIGESMDADDPHRPIIKEILSQIRRLDAAVKDLLVYARPRPAAAGDADIAHVFSRVLTVLLQEPALRKVEIDHSRVQEGCIVCADEAQLEQLLMNLIINAADASSPGDTITLRAMNSGGHALIDVMDEGQGMSRANIERAFEPFFTTKAKGTGLGLSICKRIVDVHMGEIHIDSTLGEGTTVSIRLPRHHEPPTPTGTS